MGQSASNCLEKCTAQYCILTKAQELDACSNLRSWPEFLAIQSASNHILVNAVDLGQLAGESFPEIVVSPPCGELRLYLAHKCIKVGLRRKNGQ